ncbi:hypothetical protein CF65_01527 [Aggregatibacter actinomycetemcomitans HK1651]|nr:hypothetical protein CF65_01527 [Aggregatibacter actinomycetemcomitans HK1651]
MPRAKPVNSNVFAKMDFFIIRSFILLNKRKSAVDYYSKSAPNKIIIFSIV